MTNVWNFLVVLSAIIVGILLCWWVLTLAEWFTSDHHSLSQVLESQWEFIQKLRW